MKKTLSLLICLLSIKAYSQLPDDALRTAWYHTNGSARNVATGGVMGSLGGDITAANINPAGLGLFKTGEFVFSPSVNFNNNKFNFRGTDTSSIKNKFNYGPIGFIVGGSSRYKNSKWSSSAFAISVNQLANFNNNISFKGFNNFSSFTEKYLEELVYDNADTNAALSRYIYGSSLAFRSFLIDTSNNALGVWDGYQSMVPISTGINQDYNEITRGGIHEIALAVASNMEDKLYIGGSLNIPIISYKRVFNYSETDATNNTNNDFKYFKLREETSSSGVGVGAKLGIIYKPTEYWRLGFALHTPQLIAYTDKIRAWLDADTEGYAGKRSVSSDNLNNGNPGVREYSLATPLRAIASASYVFREVENTKQQRAFLSADIEFVNYSGARFSTVESEDASPKAYLQMVNTEVKDYYRSNFNFKLGGEIKFHTIMFRLGGAYYGSPYKDKQLKANKLILAGGLGYRNHGIFIDLGYSHSMNKDVVFPYRLVDKPNTFAYQTGNKGNLILTFGIKF